MSDFKERNEHFSRAMTDAQVSYIEAERAACDLEAENAKLRELVADVWGYISHPANATWTHEKRKEVRHSLSDRMRELGIEVDG